jgi:hypothetical protein
VTLERNRSSTVLLAAAAVHAVCPLPTAAAPSAMLDGWKTVIEAYTAQLNAVACSGLLPEALVFAEKEVATNSAMILPAMATAIFIYT